MRDSFSCRINTYPTLATLEFGAVQLRSVIREFKIQRNCRDENVKKNNKFNKQNHNYAHASNLVVRFFACCCTTKT